MTDYIRRNDALEITTRTCGDCATAFSEIRKLPAADVAPVRYGRWERMRQSETTWRCSACDVMVGAFLAGCSHYCYCCGAKMDGGERK